MFVAQDFWTKTVRTFYPGGFNMSKKKFRDPKTIRKMFFTISI